MSRTFDKILKSRAEYFANFVASLRDALDAKDIEPGDDALISVAVQLYAIEPDEDEIYGVTTEDEDDEWE
jgi:hypothetical protein